MPLDNLDNLENSDINNKLSSEDVNILRHFYQVLKQQEQTYNQLYIYMSVKYNIKQEQQVNLDTGEII